MAAQKPDHVVEYKIIISTMIAAGGLADARFSTALAKDIAAAAKSLPDTKDVWVFRKQDPILGATGGGGDLWTETIAVSIPIVCAAAGYVGKKAVDVLSDIVKTKIISTTSQANASDITIYGPDGKILKRIPLRPTGLHAPALVTRFLRWFKRQ